MNWKRWALLGAVLLATAPALAHKYHASLTTVEWNAENKALEVVVRVFADDLEAAITKSRGTSFQLESADETAVAAYLAEHVVFRIGDTRLKPNWVGMEMDVRQLWAYIEIPVPQGIEGLALHHSVFFDLFGDQINTVNVNVTGTVKSLVFDRNRPRQSLL